MTHDFKAAYDDIRSAGTNCPFMFSKDDRTELTGKEALRIMAEVQEGRLQLIQGWQPIETAPRDGTMLLLCCVSGDYRTEDSIIWRTIGSNNFDHDGVDIWKMAGWCWNADEYVSGDGQPTHWMRLPDASDVIGMDDK